MKTKSEISKAFRERQGEALKAKERDRGIRKRSKMTDEQKKNARLQARERMKKMRERKKINCNSQGPSNAFVPSVYRSQSSETKALQR
jgi:hypothetical protein